MTKSEMQDSANAAADWVVRLQGETADEGDWLAFDHWLSASEGHGPAYDRALALWLELDAAAPALRHCTRRPALISWRMSAAAGALAAGLALGWVLVSNHPAPIAGELYETAIGEHKSVTLADGSRLDLDGATRISVRLEQNTRRVTMDHGEAIYEVAPDSRRPFIILAGDRQVRVVGTEFDVRQRDGAFSLTVRHGVVEVSPAGSVDDAVVRLVQGDRLDHIAGQPDRRSSGVSADEIFGWRSGQLIYRERPLSEVVADLNAHYVRPISLDAKAAGQPFSGVLALDSEEEVVHRLTLLTSLWSTSNDTGYVLHAKGGVSR
jgi:transmembrane sensor